MPDSRLPELVVKEEPGLSPVPAHGAIRDLEDFGGLLDRQVAEEAELHHACHAIVHFGQFHERPVQGQDFQDLRVLGRVVVFELEGNLPGAPFPGQSLARLTDQDLPHGPGGHGKEVRPVLPVRPGSGETEVDLVHHGGRTQGPGPLAAQVAPGDAPQVLIN